MGRVGGALFVAVAALAVTGAASARPLQDSPADATPVVQTQSSGVVIVTIPPVTYTISKPQVDRPPTAYKPASKAHFRR
jgi:hypothetical protein